MLSISEYGVSDPEVKSVSPEDWIAPGSAATRPLSGIVGTGPIASSAGETSVAVYTLANFIEYFVGEPDAEIQSHLLGDLPEDFEIRLGAHHLDRLLQPLHFAADVGHGAVLFVRGRGGENDIGLLRGLGHKEVLHDHESLLRRERGALQRIRAHYPQDIQVGRRQHLFAGQSAIARQHTHVERAAGIRVIDQANVFDRDAERIAKSYQLSQSVALHGVAEHDHQVAFSL